MATHVGRSLISTRRVMAALIWLRLYSLALTSHKHIEESCLRRNISLVGVLFLRSWLKWSVRSMITYGSYRPMKLRSEPCSEAKDSESDAMHNVGSVHSFKFVRHSACVFLHKPCVMHSLAKLRKPPQWGLPGSAGVNIVCGRTAPRPQY